MRYNVCLFVMTTLILIYVRALATMMRAHLWVHPFTDRHTDIELWNPNRSIISVVWLLLLLLMLLTANIAIDFFTMCVCFFVSIFKGSLRVYVLILLYLFVAIAMRYKAPDLIKMNKKAGETEKKSKASDGEIESVTQAIYWLCGKNNIGRIKNTFVGFVTNLSTKISFGHW